MEEVAGGSGSGGDDGWFQVVVDGVKKRKGKIVYNNEFGAILSTFGTTFNKPLLTSRKFYF